MPKTYQVPLDQQESALKSLESRTDPEAARIKRYLAMPDLSRTPGSPLSEIVERVRNIPVLSGFDEIVIPEIVSTDILFDLFDFAADHPARSTSDTYYVDKTHVLRTHDTVFWYYHLQLPEIKERIAKREKFGAICYGKVYRKDEIDRRHMNIFHQMGAWYLVPEEEELSFDDLKKVLIEVVRSVFGEVKYRFVDETFPYTDPSIEVEVEVNGEWIEIVGSGMPKPSVLKKMGVEGYKGWAFGFGLERLAIIGMELPDIRLLWSSDERVKSQLKLGQKYKEVSKFPPAIRDISFVVPTESFVLNDYFDRIRDIGGEQVEQVELIDKYENAEKFGVGKISYTFRITYRDLGKTLTSEEANAMHARVEEATKSEFGGEIRL